MKLLHTSLLNGVSVIIKLVTLLGINKALAVHIGPAGFAVAGQLQSLLGMVYSLAASGLGAGVVKYTAENTDGPTRMAVWRAAALLCFGFSALMAAVLALWHQAIAAALLGDRNLAAPMLGLALAVMFVSFNGLVLAILTGLKRVQRYIALTIASSLVTAVLVIALVKLYALEGAITALILAPILMTGVSALMLRGAPGLGWLRPVGRDTLRWLKPLTAYSGVALICAVAAPVTALQLRNDLVAQLGWAPAGLWQAAAKISEVHILFFTTTLSLYFLPRFSEAATSHAARRELLKGYTGLIPAVAATALGIALLGGPITQFLFSSSFKDLGALLPWQMAGDVCKVGAWFCSFYMIGRGILRPYLLLDVGSCVVWVVLSHLLVARFGLAGTSMAYAATFLLYWILGIAVIWRDAGSSDQAAVHPGIQPKPSTNP